MATKKKLIEMESKHQEWLRNTALDLKLFERDIINHVFEYAITNNAVGLLKQKAATNELQQTVNRLQKFAQEAAALQERGEEVLKKVESGDGGTA